MACPHCKSAETTMRRGATSLGYCRFVCRACGRRFNERTGTDFNDLQYPTDIVLNAVLWRLRHKLKPPRRVPSGFRVDADLRPADGRLSDPLRI